MNKPAPNPYEFKKEITVRLTQKVGEITYEVEVEKGKEKAELRATFERNLELLTDLEPYELKNLGQFFLRAANEAAILNGIELGGREVLPDGRSGYSV